MILKTSCLSGFYKKTHSQRLQAIQEFSSLSEQEYSLLKNCSALSFSSANLMVENVISTLPVPLGVATNFMVNGKEYLVPMATEEASVIAAASYAAKLSRQLGGFSAQASEPIMICQIQLKNISNLEKAQQQILESKEKILDIANSHDSILVKLGGGARDIELRPIKTPRGTMLIVHLLVNVKDAMGANIVNTMGEAITKKLEDLSGGIAGLRIVSNLAVHRTVQASTVWDKNVIGQQVIENILDAHAFAQADSFRCTTHNKGIMNGIDAVALATGNDFRAIEAGAHAYAAQNQSYQPLTHYDLDINGNLRGSIKLPLAVGTVGGLTQCHPVTKLSLKILNVASANELACVMAAVGLAQNFGALRALVCEGIQKGHMKLHSKNIALTAGAPKHFVDLIAKQMIKENNISVGRAKEILDSLNQESI